MLPSRPVLGTRKARLGGRQPPDRPKRSRAVEVRRFWSLTRGHGLGGVLGLIGGYIVAEIATPKIPHVFHWFMAALVCVTCSAAANSGIDTGTRSS